MWSDSKKLQFDNYDNFGDNDKIRIIMMTYIIMLGGSSKYLRLRGFLVNSDNNNENE